MISYHNALDIDPMREKSVLVIDSLSFMSTLDSEASCAV